MSTFPTLAIIGPGRVGTSIAIAARKVGYPIVVAGRNHKHSEDAAALIDSISFSKAATERPTPAVSITDAVAQANIVLLTVNDGSIESMCEELANMSAFARGSVVAHTSGALPSDILSAAKRTCGCAIASVHPLQTFAVAESAQKDLQGIHWFLEGDAQAVTVLTKLVVTLGGKPKEITPEQKPLYHAASVVAGNYLTALIDVAVSIMEEISIDRTIALSALQPLIKSSINNTLQIGPEQALTGPISRGDTRTVEHHLKALTTHAPDLAEIYRSIGRHTVALALRKRSIAEHQANELLKILR